MALASAIKGARHTAQVITWKDGDGDAQDLTGATLTGRIGDRNGETRLIDGALAVTNAAGGEFTWAYGSGDVAVSGDFLVQFVATYGDGKNDKTLVEPWRVEREIVVV